MSCYLYLIEFFIKDFSLWNLPKEIENSDELETNVNFRMLETVKLEFSDEDLKLSECQKVVKSAVFNVTKEQLKRDVCAYIEVFKLKKCPDEKILVGSYKFNKLECSIKETTDEFEQKTACSEEKPKFTSTILNELLPLTNECLESSGIMYYTMKISCFGPSITQNINFSNDKAFISKLEDRPKSAIQCKPCPPKEPLSYNASELDCLRVPHPSPTPSCTQLNDTDETGGRFDEYTASVNDNCLTVRVSKSSHLVTRVYDTDMKPKQNEMSLCMGDKKILLKVPSKLKFAKRPPVPRHCCQEAHITPHQKKTSCDGNSFKNSDKLPVIRGNLKYPGNMECDDKITFEIPESCPKLKPKGQRTVCQQITQQDLKLVPEDPTDPCQKIPHVPKGIEVCKKGCSDPDVDVFVLKIGQKKHSSKKNSIIELEMRTPKGPNIEIPRKETREVQVIESEFGSAGKGGKGKGKKKSKGKKK